MKQRREPLEPEELRALVHAGENMDLKHDFTIKVLAFTGLRAAELAHVTEDWIVWQEDLIRVPAYQSCDCSYCRSQAKENDVDVDEYWHPKSDAGARTIPVWHIGTLRVMREYFKRNTTVGVTRQTIHDRVKRVAAETDIRRNVMPHVLRHTYGTMIAANGASAQFITQTMGHEDISSSGAYIQFSGRQLSKEADEIFGVASNRDYGMGWNEFL
jgi:Site-specific recombinase XerD